MNNDTESLEIDGKKVEKVLKKILSLINDNDLLVPEVVDLIGRLMFIAGGTFAGFKSSDIKPTEIDLVKNYNEDPTLDVALMIDGLNVLSSIKEKRRDMPVVLNSAYSTYKRDFNSWLADAYVVKSSDLAELKSKIRELISI